MCGIAGFVSRHPQPAAPVAAMTSLVRHRGPDDEGYLLFVAGESVAMSVGGPDTPQDVRGDTTPYAPTRTFESVKSVHVTVALGHRRLKITDLSSAGHQPMCTRDRRRWIVFNGAVFNHVELRQELRGLGHSFTTLTDTEVILAAYVQWGEACLLRFNGKWAFAILDVGAGEVFLARDRFGVKPLYYWVSPDGTFCFGSEIKQFTAFPGWSPRVNPDCAHDVLALGLLDHTDETLFRGVYQIPGGHSTRLRLGAPAPLPHSRVPLFKWYVPSLEPFAGSYADAVDQYRAVFRDAVALRLRADVPIGAGLSGGLDSSAIVCQAAEVLNAQGYRSPLPTFTAYTEDPQLDERKWVAAVGNHTAIDPTFVCPTLTGLFEELDDFVWHLDEPVGYTSAYAEWSVYRAVQRAGVKVTLEGHGADEVLGGYSGFLFANVAGMLASGRWRQAFREFSILHQSGRSLGQAIPATLKSLLPGRLRDSGRRLVGRPRSNPDWLDTDLTTQLSGNAFRDESRPGIRGLSVMQLLHTSLPYQLHSADRSSMAHSTEMRHPFLDCRLVELTLACPDDFKIANGVTKRVLRDALRRTLPAQVAARTDKIGFAMPEASWVQTTAPA